MESLRDTSVSLVLLYDLSSLAHSAIIKWEAEHEYTTFLGESKWKMGWNKTGQFIKRLASTGFQTLYSWYGKPCVSDMGIAINLRCCNRCEKPSQNPFGMPLIIIPLNANSFTAFYNFLIIFDSYVISTVPTLKTSRQFIYV